MDRRELIKGLAIAGAGASVGAGEFPRSASNKGADRSLRIAHITDMHVIPERNAAHWLSTCINHIQSLEDPPDLIFNGGDAIHNGLSEDKDRVQAMWDIWTSVIDAECELPMINCIGNHDVWGSADAEGDPLYGKQWARDQLALDSSYYSFTESGWHVVVLDSTQTQDDGSWYEGRLDEEQFDWLKADLQATPHDEPILVFSHIPILSASTFFFGEKDRTGDWVIPSWLMHIDAKRIVELFNEHPNIQLAISGHVHLLDSVNYNDITYYCNGAVSGAWWHGPHRGLSPGYAIINLYHDGRFSREYVTYGWEPR